MSWLFGKTFRLISRSWQMYLVGFLFGLGFDTATEIGVLGISAAGASSGISIWSIMVFPALFASGMALVDTLDNVLMVGAYGWAFSKAAAQALLQYDHHRYLGGGGAVYRRPGGAGAVNG